MKEELKTALEADPGNPFLQGHIEALEASERTAPGSSGAGAGSHSRRVPRNLLVVLDQILEIIPLHEMEIRRSLDLHHSANLYRAPELQDWHGVAATLQLHCEGRSEPWIEESLAVWRDDANSQPTGR